MSDNIVYNAAATILLVDDDEMVRHLLFASLRGAGFSVAMAADANEALDWIGTTHHLPKLLVTDVDMPGMTGIELARRTQTLGHCPILLISGKTPEAALTESWEFLPKPFTPAVFVSVVQKIVSNAERTQSDARIQPTPESRHDRLVRKAR